MVRPPGIETSRLLLRRTLTRDVPWLRELLVDERVRRTTLQRRSGAWQSWVEAYLGVRCNDARWAIVEKRSGEGLGWILFDDWSHPPLPSIGFELRPAYWNRGFMTEALRAAVEHRLEARGDPALRGVVFDGNRASRRVFEKCGFRLVMAGPYEGHSCVFYQLDRLPRHDGGVADLHASLAGGQHLAGVEPALRIK